MTADTDLIETVCEALADPECREILSELDEYRSAREVVDRCGVAKTSAYRKLDQLTDAGLVDERIEPGPDGHHVTEYQRDFSGVLVTHETGEEYSLQVIKGNDSPDEQLASFWSQISEEL
jgi:DNA-binding transcriptional ArsR family regulator